MSNKMNEPQLHLLPCNSEYPPSPRWGARLMSYQPHIGQTLKQELSDWRRWLGRALVLAFAAVAGLTVVAYVNRFTQCPLILSIQLILSC
jgi:hypothetical protein